MWGAFVRSVQPPLAPTVQMARGRSLRPDLRIMGGHDQMVAVVEYESTNSSDERLVDKDIRNYESHLGLRGI